MNVDDSFDYDSDSEVEDDEDVDSNAEDFYKNEYPDEEQSEDGSNAGSSGIQPAALFITHKSDLARDRRHVS